MINNVKNIMFSLYFNNILCNIYHNDKYLWSVQFTIIQIFIKYFNKRLINIYYKYRVLFWSHNTRVITTVFSSIIFPNFSFFYWSTRNIQDYKSIILLLIYLPASAVPALYFTSINIKLWIYSYRWISEFAEGNAPARRGFAVSANAV